MFSWSQPKEQQEPASRTRSGRLLHQDPPGGQQDRNNSQQGSNPSVIMVNFDNENGQDPENIHTKLQSITLEFDHQDIPYWFSQAEMQMEIWGIKSQWMKRIVLQRLLQKKVAMNVKGLLSKSKSKAGNSIYKDIKDSSCKSWDQKNKTCTERLHPWSWLTPPHSWLELWSTYCANVAQTLPSMGAVEKPLSCLSCTQ